MPLYNNFTQYFFIFFCCSLIPLIFIQHGRFLSKKILFLDIKKINYYELGLIGIISISLYALIVNFFFKLDNIINLIIIFFPILFFSINKKIITISLKIGLISFVILILENTYRPDAGLYHLPFISILNEYNLIIGSANLQFRFGHISILQYLSAIFNNFIFTENGILIPPATIFALIVSFIFKEFKNKIYSEFYRFISFLFLITIIITMSRYGEFGNDQPGHVFFFITLITFLKIDLKKINNIEASKIFLYSSYAFLIKPLLIFALFFPLILILMNIKNALLLKRVIIFSFIFIILWLFRNFLTSSCFLYPIKITCFNNFDWSASKNLLYNPEYISDMTEAWSKDYPNRIKKTLNEKDYISDINWLNVWLKNHFLVIIKKIYIILIILIFLIIIKFKKFSNSEIFFLKKKIYIIFFVSLVGTIVWFLKFPTYRYGSSYILSFLIFSYLMIFFIKKRKLNNFKESARILVSIIIILTVLVLIKNLIRIYKNYDHYYTDYPWPKKNSYTENNNQNKNIPVYNNPKKFLYFKPAPYELCMYSPSPCSSEIIENLDVKKIKFLNNLIYFPTRNIDNKDKKY